MSESRDPVRRKSWLSAALELVGWVLLCQGVGALGAVVTIDGVRTWYSALIRPGWTPPNWVFGPVWTLLYLLMAVAAWRVSRKKETHKVGQALLAFGVQLALNCAWSFLFFGMHLIGVSFLEILMVLAAIIWTMVLFAQIDRVATWLLVPYLLWVCYASTLNGGFWWLNGG